MAGGVNPRSSSYSIIFVRVRVYEARHTQRLLTEHNITNHNSNDNNNK